MLLCYRSFSLVTSFLTFEAEVFEKILTSIVSSVPFFKYLSAASPRASHPSGNEKPRYIFKAFFEFVNPVFTKVCPTLFVDMKTTEKVLI